ncbi:hypothetical protein NVP1151O_48 [Vibrio phage 1.151.O._10N.222.46.B1]|nr:hypothetical protein NVP1151O_48 [Vibrio phage 1.151.O._10N.222.46.B1]
MAILLIAVIDEKAKIPAVDVTRAVVMELASKYSNVSDKIRAMQEMNKHPLLKELGLRINWRFEYGE